MGDAETLKPVRCKCGGIPETFTRFPVAKQMYRGEVYCPECHDRIFSIQWHHDKESAIDDAVGAWNKAMEADNE